MNGLRTTGSQHAVADRIYSKHTVPLSDLANLRAAFNRLRISALDHLVAPDAAA